MQEPEWVVVEAGQLLAMVLPPVPAGTAARNQQQALEATVVVEQELAVQEEMAELVLVVLALQH